MISNINIFDYSYNSALLGNVKDGKLFQRILKVIERLGQSRVKYGLGFSQYLIQARY